MMITSRAVALAIALLPAMGCSSPATAQDYSGRWIYTENDDTAAVVIRLDRGSNRFDGSIELFGREAPITGHVLGGVMTVDSLAGSPTQGTMEGRLEDGALILVVAPSDAAPTVLRLFRADGAPGTAAGSASRSPARSLRDATSPQVSAAELTGDWEAAADDGTYREVVRLDGTDAHLQGEAVAVSRGYFSGREEVQRHVVLEGAIRGGRAELRVRDAAGGDAVPATAYRRGDYLVLRVGDSETGYARPGEPLVRDATGDASAEALARAVTGRIYSSSTQASGRNGGFVGQRLSLALCGDGTIAYSASDMASVPGGLPDVGMDMGSSRSRRGTWNIVLLAGVPVVRAQWEGTGTSYSLTEYFRVQPTNGGAASVDGVELPVTGSC